MKTLAFLFPIYKIGIFIKLSKKTHNLKMTKIPKYSLALLACLLLAGCSATLKKFREERQLLAEYDHGYLKDHHSPIFDKPLTLDDILTIAMRYNLDVQIQQIEYAVASKAKVAEMLKMLPALTLSGEQSSRNKNTAYSSKSLATGITGPPAISSETSVHKFDFTAIWGIIDFGMAFYNSHQEKNRGFILLQRHERARQNLILDITKAYYRALWSRNAKEKAEALIAELEVEGRKIQEQIERQVISESKGLANRTRLVELRIKLQAFENEHQSALTELMGLMGIVKNPEQRLVIADTPFEEIHTEIPSIDELELIALKTRPELLSQDIQVAVDRDEVRKAILQLFPNAQIFGGFYHDGNKYLLFNNWYLIGARASEDLLSIPSKAANVSRYKYQHVVSARTRLSISMGIITQVHLAHINVMETLAQYKLAQELYLIKRKMWEVGKMYLAAGRANPSEVLDLQAEMLFAEVNAKKSFGDARIALEQLGNAVGEPKRF